MNITFSASGVLRRYIPGAGDSAVVDLPPGATVADLFQHLDMTWGEVGVIAVNRQMAGEETVLREGDRVELFAPIGGG